MCSASFFPDDADALAQKAAEAGQSRVLAGVQRDCLTCCSRNDLWGLAIGMTVDAECCNPL